MYFALVIIAVVLFVTGTSFLRSHVTWLRPEAIQSFLESARSSQWAFAIVWILYILCGFVMFPIMVLSLLIAAVFGPLWGTVYGLPGMLLSASLMFAVGRGVGLPGSNRFLSERLQKLDQHFANTGLWGITMLRLLPVAPFALINLGAGISSVRYFDFIVGSFIGVLPAFIVRGFVGNWLLQALLHPQRETYLYLALGVACWALLVFVSYTSIKFLRKRQMAKSLIP